GYTSSKRIRVDGIAPGKVKARGESILAQVQIHFGDVIKCVKRLSYRADHARERCRRTVRYNPRYWRSVDLGIAARDAEGPNFREGGQGMGVNQGAGRKGCHPRRRRREVSSGKNVIAGNDLLVKTAKQKGSVFDDWTTHREAAKLII